MKISATIIVLTLALTVLCGVILYSTQVAYADSDTLYAYVEPSNLIGNEYAQKSSVAVCNNSEEVLFYLIESYYYPVYKTIANFYKINFDSADDFYIQATDLTTAPQTYNSVSAENCLPQKLNTIDDVVIDGTIVNTSSGWTIRLIGLTADDKYYVQAQNGSATCFGAVERTSFTTQNVPYHPIAQDERNNLIANPSTESQTVEEEGKTSVALRVILIIGILIPATIVAVLIFVPNRKERSFEDKREMRKRDKSSYDDDRNYRDERDYDDRYPRDYRRDDRDSHNYDRRDDRYQRDDRDNRGYDRDDRDYRDRNRDYPDNDRDSRRRNDYDDDYNQNNRNDRNYR